MSRNFPGTLEQEQEETNDVNPDGGSSSTLLEKAKACEEFQASNIQDAASGYVETEKANAAVGSLSTVNQHQDPDAVAPGKVKQDVKSLATDKLSSAGKDSGNIKGGRTEKSPTADRPRPGSELEQQLMARLLEYESGPALVKDEAGSEEQAWTIGWEWREWLWNFFLFIVVIFAMVIWNMDSSSVRYEGETNGGCKQINTGEGQKGRKEEVKEGSTTKRKNGRDGERNKMQNPDVRCNTRVHRAACRHHGSSALRSVSHVFLHYTRSPLTQSMVLLPRWHLEPKGRGCSTTALYIYQAQHLPPLSPDVIRPVVRPRIQFFLSLFPFVSSLLSPSSHPSLPSLSASPPLLLLSLPPSVRPCSVTPTPATVQISPAAPTFFGAMDALGARIKPNLFDIKPTPRSGHGSGEVSLARSNDDDGARNKKTATKKQATRNNNKDTRNANERNTNEEEGDRSAASAGDGQDTQGHPSSHSDQPKGQSKAERLRSRWAEWAVEFEEMVDGPWI